MHVHQASRRKLGWSVWEGSGEGALMVVIAVRRCFIFTAYVDNGMTSLEKGRISGPDELRGLVGGQQTQHVHSKGFIGVEMAIVSADRKRGHLDSLYCCHAQGVAEHAKANEVCGCWIVVTQEVTQNFDYDLAFKIKAAARSTKLSRRISEFTFATRRARSLRHDEEVANRHKSLPK
jgi:hypothetical protein